MTRPGDEIAGGRGRLRASHADREQVVEVLKAAFVQGRLDSGEFDARVGQALVARTYAQLAAVTADIPAGPPAAVPPAAVPPSHGKARSAVSTGIKAGAGTIVVTTVLVSQQLGATWLQTAGFVVFALIFGIIVAGILAIPLAGIVMLESRQSQRSGGQLPPPGSGPRGEIPGHAGTSAPDGRVPPAGPDRPGTAEAAGRDRYRRPRGRRYPIGGPVAFPLS